MNSRFGQNKVRIIRKGFLEPMLQHNPTDRLCFASHWMVVFRVELILPIGAARESNFGTR